MLATNTRTEAEEQLARQFEAVAGRLPGGSWMPAARKRAMGAFARAGLPHRRIEEWKYTDLRAGLKAAFPPATCPQRKVDQSMLVAVLGAELAGLACIRHVLVNGRLVASMVPAGHEPGSSYHCVSLAGSLGQPGFEWIESHLGSESVDQADAVMALNGAFVTDGVVLNVAEGARLHLPVHIVSIVDSAAPAAVATRNLIRIERGARATVIESHVEVGGSISQCTAVTEIRLAPAAAAGHVKHVAIGARSAHLGRIDAEIGGGAEWRGFQVTAGAGLLRNESRVR
ncbi:MAG: hypothetical protein SFW09_24020, partial [Hyphomicrobiaceae bacterium]|nr:hypothetical protein [Hyphomicrobiaceae bacterium]